MAHTPTPPASPGNPRRGRGATFDPPNRFRDATREVVDDGWAPSSPDPADEAPSRQIRTTVTIQLARSIVARNDSPDIPFDRSINPYRGCEHGCIYCYARPSHAYLDHSPGIDFETKLYAKPDAARLLREELARPGYDVAPIALGTNTDPYQPVEREWRITRSLLEVFAQTKHPFTIVTKNALVERDLDLIAPMAAQGLARVCLSITTLDAGLARKLEPRASAPARRVEALRELSAAGVPAGVMVAPVIPQLTDRDLEAILEAAAGAGAQSAGWIMLRLPREVAPLFRDWLAAHFPDRAAHVMSLVQDIRGGRDYDARFGARLKGRGAFADLIAKRFDLACRRIGLCTGRDRSPLDCTKFVAPSRGERQRSLF